MVPARCGHCGETVMSFQRSILHLGQAACQHCGRLVRVRYQWSLFVGGLAFGFGALMLAIRAGLSTDYSWWMVAAVFGIITLIALAAEWWCWKALPWEVVGESTASKSDISDE